MMNWKILYTKDAEKDLGKLDNSQRIQVLKAIKKVSQNPLPKNEGGYGTPLRNLSSSKLSGFMKVKLKKLGIRVVYKIIYDNEVMYIVIISTRADDEVYVQANKRIDSDERL